ncbi:MAG: helix-hairpin-helix domain-containing protein [Saprospiraceae bacterium]|nr:helix-hairpin-helix domain-containing protein [Saprospiraceae bacterium]
MKLSLSLLFFFNLTLCLTLKAQEDLINRDVNPVNGIVESIIASNPDLSDAQLNDLTERLGYLFEHKIDINSSDLKVFEELLLLNELQVHTIFQHIDKYGKLISVYELQSVPGMEVEDIRRIMPFVRSFGLDGISPFRPDMLYKGSKTLLVRYGRVLQNQAGYRGEEPKYLGSQDQFSIRLRHVVPGRVSIGIGAEKDVGEPFDTQYNPLLFDFTTFHVYLEKVNRRIKKVVLGDFQASMGQGLILFSGYGFGRSAFTTAVRRNERSLRPSTSLNEINALRGAGLELNLSENITLMTFGSYKKSDGNAILPDSLSNDPDEIISSIQQSGLHRTLSEIRNKGHINQLTAGASLQYNGHKMNIGLNTIYDKLDKRLNPTDRVYNRFYFKGQEALNSSINYSFYIRNLVLYGETAINPEGAVATVNGALIGLHPKVSMALLFRYLPKEYYSLHGKVFSDQTVTTNETGLYAGLEIKPFPKLIINAYADLFRHDWATYSADGPSEGSAYLFKVAYQERKKWESYIQIRFQSEEVTGVSKDVIPSLYFRQKTDVRLHFIKKVGSLMTLASRLDYNHLRLPGNKDENGYLMYQEWWMKPLGKPYSGFVRFTHFNIDSYQSRIYSYEHYQAYDSRNIGFDGVGNRFVTGLRWKMHNGIVLEASYNMTKYKNKTYIGSGNDKINGPIRSEIRAQIRYGFGD